MGSCLIVDSISVITLSKVPGFFQARILHSFANFCGSDSNRNYLFICFHSAMNYIHATRTDRRARCRWLLGAGREGMCFLSRAVSLNQTAHTPSTGVAVKVTKGLEYRFPPASVGLAVWGDRFTSLGPPHTLWVRAALPTSSATYKQCQHPISNQFPSAAFPCEYSISGGLQLCGRQGDAPQQSQNNRCSDFVNTLHELFPDLNVCTLG